MIILGFCICGSGPEAALIVWLMVLQSYVEPVRIPVWAPREEKALGSRQGRRIREHQCFRRPCELGD
jgi:hypothetical protein